MPRYKIFVKKQRRYCQIRFLCFRIISPRRLSGFVRYFARFCPPFCPAFFSVSVFFFRFSLFLFGHFFQGIQKNFSNFSEFEGWFKKDFFWFKKPGKELILLGGFSDKSPEKSEEICKISNGNEWVGKGYWQVLSPSSSNDHS